MTLRLPEELDKQLEEIARERHVSKHSVLIEAATRFVSTESKTDRVLRTMDEVMQQYAEAIKKLEDA